MSFELGSSLYALASVAQLAPAMRAPRSKVAYRTMALVIITIGLTSPLLTLWQTTLVPDPNNPSHVNQLLSLLGGQYGGPALSTYVAVTGSLLLIFASNTAIIGGYHVFLALTRMGFLPRIVERYNSWRRTPHVAILAAVVPPVGLVYLAGQSPVAAVFLGDLYAFGLLGSFILTSFSLDVIRWHELRQSATLRRRLVFAIGVLTTLLVLLGWSSLVMVGLALYVVSRTSRVPLWSPRLARIAQGRASRAGGRRANVIASPAT